MVCLADHQLRGDLFVLDARSNEFQPLELTPVRSLSASVLTASCFWPRRNSFIGSTASCACAVFADQVHIHHTRSGQSSSACEKALSASLRRFKVCGISLAIQCESETALSLPEPRTPLQDRRTPASRWSQ